jgi:PAS domain S-box-containing protein
MTTPLSTLSPRKLVRRYSPVLIGVCAGVVFWFIDVLTDVYVFGDGDILGQILHPSPREVWIRTFALCMIVGSGFIVGRLSASRKLVEDELRMAHMRLRDGKAWSEGALDAVADGVSIQAPDYRILYQNRAHREFQGDHLGEYCYAAYEKQSFVCTDCPLAHSLRDGGVHTAVRTVVINGTPRDFEITTSPLADASGRIVAGIEAVREITERKRAETSLRESEQKFRTLFEESKDVFYISTLDGSFLNINPAGVELFGYASKEELLRVDIGRDIYVDQQERKRFVDAVSETGYAKDYEVQMRRKTGEKLTVLITSTALRDQQGRVTGFRGVIRDITEHKKLEHQLLQSQKMEAVGLLAGGIAHDFNNILTAILGYGNLLKTNLRHDERLQGFAGQVLEAAARASGLTRSILAFSRKQILKPEPVDLNTVIARVEKFLARLIGEDIVLKAVLHGADMTVMADSVQIEQVLINLATNARDAMPAGGTLTIETSIERLNDGQARVYGLSEIGTYAVVTVKDTGKGVDEETQARIFEPFFTTKEAGKGTGLGLSIVHGIVNQHGGSIMVESAPGAGTTFKIYLPLVPAGDDEPPVAPETTPPCGTETILLAEDSDTVRELLRFMLEDAGYTVIEASDGNEAIRAFRENQPRVHLLILDVVMPGKNGKETFDEIRKQQPDVKALFVSGYTADIIHTKGIFDPSLDFIAKPVSGDTLLRKVREVLDRKQVR